MLYIMKALGHPAEMKHLTPVEHCLVLSFPQSSHFGKCCVHICTNIRKESWSDEAVNRTIGNRSRSSTIRDKVVQKGNIFRLLSCEGL